MPGFLFLHSLFIERGRLETVWQVSAAGTGGSPSASANPTQATHSYRAHA